MKPGNVPAAEWKAEKKENLNWLLRDQAAQGLTKGAANSSQWPHVTKADDTSKEMWDIWQNMYVTNQQRIDVHYHFEDLYTRKYVDATSMADHIAGMLDLGHKITAAGESLPDIHVARTLILSLPHTQSWDVIKIQLFNLEASKLTFNMVSATLIAEANRRMREKSSKIALLMGNRQGGGKDQRGKGGPKAEDECRSCHQKGQWASKCPKWEEDEKEKGTGKANLTTSELKNL